MGAIKNRLSSDTEKLASIMDNIYIGLKSANRPFWRDMQNYPIST
jgi:hypothetical protein